MLWAKQSTAATLIVGPILDSTGAEYTGAVIGDVSLSKNGATLTALASAATLTHIANGQYTLVLTTGNTDTLGRAQILCNKSTYQMPPLEMMVMASAVYDTLITNGTLASMTSGRTLTVSSGGTADANATQWLGTAPLALSSQQVQAVVPDAQKVDVNTIKTQTVTCAAGVTVSPFVGNATAAIVVSAGGTASANVTNWLSAAPLALSSQQVQAVVPSTQKVDVETIKTQTVTCGAGVTVAPFVGNSTAAIVVSAGGTASANVTQTLGTLSQGSAGYIGIDWAKISSPTTAVNLSGTTVKTATDVEADTQDIQARLPAALVSGRMDSSVGAMAANTLTAASLASDAGAEIAAAVWDLATSGHTTSGTFGAAMAAAGAAGDPWSTSLPGSYGAGTAGYIVGNNIDAAISSRGTSTLTQTQVTGGAYALNSSSFGFNSALDFTTTQKTSLNAATPSVSSIAGDVGGKVLGGGSSTITGTGVRAVNSAGNVIAEKAKQLSSDIWTDTAASYLDVAVSSRLAAADYVPGSSPDVTAIKAVTDKLATMIEDGGGGVWRFLQSAVVKVGNVLGFTTADLAAVLAALGVTTTAIKAKTDNIPGSPAAVGDVPTALANATQLLASIVEGTKTVLMTLRLLRGAAGGKSSVVAGTRIYRDTTDAKDRITATTDEFGQRTAVTLDET